MPKPKVSRFDQSVGERIREARIAKKLSQKGLGGLLGVSFQQVQKYEKGKNRVSGERLESLVTALSRPIAFFLQGITDVRPQSDPFLHMRTSKDGQAIAAVWPNLVPTDQHFMVNLAERLAQERAR